MLDRMGRLLLVILAGVVSVDCLGESAGKEGKSLLDELPPHIKRITHFGQRADWSHDGKRILFIEKTFGDVYEVELATGVIRPITHHYFHEGYTRALYLSNGDIILSGARQFNADNPWPSRSERNAELWVLKKDLSGPPVPLGEKCSEGPAVSRRRLRIVWTQGGAFYSGDIEYEEGTARLVNKKKVLDKKDLPFECGLETQNLRPPDEKELIFSAYGYQGTEVCGVNLKTGKIVNYSNAPDQYDEPEGIFPDGQHTLVECDKHNRKGVQHIDLYKLPLDSSGETQRMTFFADYPGYKASNPVVSDDGKYIAFQVAKLGDPAGVGRGILIFDIEMFEVQSAQEAAELAEARKAEKLAREVDVRVETIRKDYGVTVRYKYDPAAFFPKDWLRKPISGRGSQMPAEEVWRVLDAAERFLSEYPKSVLKKNLTDIYLVAGLEFFGKVFGGAYGNSAIYINSQGESNGYDEQFLLSTMHSEFSSVLLKNYKDEFSEDAWKSANVVGFDYGGTGVEMLGREDIFAQTKVLLNRGFLVRYSQSSLENDLNMFAFWAFTRPGELQELASNYERLGKKYELVMQFYEKVDPGINLRGQREPLVNSVSGDSSEEAGG